MLRKNESVTAGSITYDEEGEEDNPIIHLTYVKLPQTLELRERQYEEQLRAKYNIPKEKTGKLL